MACVVEVVLLDKLGGIDIRMEIRVNPKDISAPNVGGDRKLEGRQPSIEASFPVDRDRDVVMGDPHVTEAVGRLHSLLPFLQLRALAGKQGLLQPEDPVVECRLTPIFFPVSGSAKKRDMVVMLSPLTIHLKMRTLSRSFFFAW